MIEQKLIDKYVFYAYQYAGIHTAPVDPEEIEAWKPKLGKFFVNVTRSELKAMLVALNQQRIGGRKNRDHYLLLHMYNRVYDGFDFPEGDRDIRYKKITNEKQVQEALDDIVLLNAPEGAPTEFNDNSDRIAYIDYLVENEIKHPGALLGSFCVLAYEFSEGKRGLTESQRETAFRAYLAAAYNLCFNKRDRDRRMQTYSNLLDFIDRNADQFREVRKPRPSRRHRIH
jgi:hypothetical protein